MNGSESGQRTVSPHLHPFERSSISIMVCRLEPWPSPYTHFTPCFHFTYLSHRFAFVFSLLCFAMLVFLCSFILLSLDVS